MKTNTATLRVIQLEQPNKQGLFPIVIRAQWNGRAEKRTGIAIPKAAWSERTSTIKSSYPNASMLNATIQNLYTEAMQRKVELEVNGKLKSAKDIFISSTKRNNTKSATDYQTLINGIISSRALSYGTQRTYFVAYHVICEFLNVDEKDGFELTILTPDTCRSLAKHLQGKGCKNGTIFNYLSSVAAVWHYAIKQKLVDADLYPFDTYNYRVAFRTEPKKKAITEDDIQHIQDLLFERLIPCKDFTPFTSQKTNEFALAMYFLGYQFGGLALIDMANLRKEQLTIKKQGNVEYFVFSEVYRQKTNQPVPIVASSNILLKTLITNYMALPGEYLFPFGAECHTSDPKHNHMVMNSLSKSINLHLRKATGLDITYYSCRHSFATVYVNSKGSNPIHLATMMGRSVNGIFRYVKTIQTEDDILRERSRMGLGFF